MIEINKLKIGDKVKLLSPLYVSKKIGEEGIPAFPGDEFYVMYIGQKYIHSSTSAPDNVPIVVELAHVLTRNIVTLNTERVTILFDHIDNQLPFIDIQKDTKEVNDLFEWDLKEVFKNITL